MQLNGKIRITGKEIVKRLAAGELIGESRGEYRISATGYGGYRVNTNSIKALIKAGTVVYKKGDYHVRLYTLRADLLAPIEL